MYDDQMEMFQDGGLKDQGNTIDPVSGNDVPSGSLKEEVRDDIDAKLSPGEFVFPADVVRFVGLEKLMLMRDKAKKGLSRMEEMGQMGNSEEATIDDDVPFGMEDLIIVSGGPDIKMNEGGMADYGADRFDQLVGQPMFESVTKVFENKKGHKLFIPFVRGQPVYEPPEGYREVTEQDLQTKFRDPTAATKNIPVADSQMDETVSGNPINTNIDSQGNILPQESASGEVDGGVAGGEKSMAEMSPAETASYGKDLAGPLGSLIKGTELALGYAGNFMFGTNPVVSTVLSRYGIPELDFTTQMRKDWVTATDLAALSPAQLEAKAKEYNAKVSVQNKKDVSKAMTNPTQRAAAVSTAYGATPTQISTHIDNISRGNVAPGTSANAFGGFSTSGPGGFSTNAEGDTIGGAAGAQIQKAKELDIDVREVLANRPDELANLSYGSQSPTLDAQISVDMYGFDSDIGKSQSGSPGTPGPGVSGANTPGGGPTSASEASGGVGAGPDTDTGQSEGQGTEEYDGGLIVRPKRKKQKKMKRGGLASR